MLAFTFNGDGVKTCKCCEKKMSSKGGLYEGVCSSTCSSQQLEYNSIPINLLFIKRLYLHINDEKILLYRKRVRIERDKLEKGSKYIISGINDIMRIYINSYTQKMDNPRIPLYTLDQDNNLFKIKGTKLYYINIIMQLQYEEQTDYKRFRISCNRSGIYRIEELNR